MLTLTLTKIYIAKKKWGWFYQRYTNPQQGGGMRKEQIAQKFTAWTTGTALFNDII